MNLGRWFGFPVDADMSALIVLGFLALRSAQGGPGAMALGLAFAIGILLSVMAHELGHAFTARAFSLGPVSITLSGFGGLTRFAVSPRPWQGIFVTLAGPFAGFLLGGVLLAVSIVDSTDRIPLIWELALANIVLSAFNLLPMYPLDGGSLVFHALAIFMHPNLAMVWSARVGLPFALAAGALAWWSGQVFLGLIVVFSLMRSVPLAIGRGLR